jgi:competence protein ComEC
LFRHVYLRRRGQDPRGIFTLLLSALVFFGLGGARYQAARPDFRDPHFIAAYNETDHPLVVTGLVTDFPDRRDHYVNLRVRTEKIRLAWDVEHSEVEGALLAKVPVDSDLHYGDRVVLRGLVQRPPDGEEFSYRDYLARQGMYAYMPRARVSLLEADQGNFLLRWIYDWKEASLETIYRLWPDPEASLFAGILLGVEAGIPAPVKKAFKHTGTSHIIAISGFNITIIAGLFSGFFNRFLNPRLSALAAVGGIVLYTVFVGADAAVVRAAVMGGFTLFARQIGRRQHGLNALAGASLLMALFNPQLPWDLSFQLSLTATLGLVLYAEPLQAWFVKVASRHIPSERAQKLSEPVGEYILFTFAAQLTTFPVMVYHFGSLSLTAFLANPVILPVQPPIMTLGGLAVILGAIWYPLGKLAAPVIWPFVLFTIRSVEFFAQIQGGVVHFPEVGLLGVAVFYGLLFLVTFGQEWVPDLREVLKPSLVMTALGVGTILVWRGVFTAPDGMLQLTLLDVGDGEGFLVRTPEGRCLLINGGSSTSLLSEGLGRRLPPFQPEMDAYLIGAPEEEHIAALPGVMDRFPPAQVFWTGTSSPGRSADYLRSAVEEREIPLQVLEEGHRLALGQGASLEVLDVSPRGGVFLLEWRRFRALLPLGVDEDALENPDLPKEAGKVSVFLLADNGYAPSNPHSWISRLEPRLVLLSVARDNPEGLPDRELIERLVGYSLLRTDQHGWVEIRTDGKRMWVTVEDLEEMWYK